MGTMANEDATYGFASRGMSRRSFLGLSCAAVLGGAMSMWGCSSGSASSSAASSSASGISGSKITMLNYEGWMGENEVASFKDSAGVTVEELPTPDGGNSAWISTLAQNKGSYDFALAGNNVASQLHENGLLAEFDESKVPNLTNIPEEYRKAFPYGIPVEQGKIGFMYNKELLPEPPKSWKALFEGAESLSGKLLFPAYDGDVIEAALLSLGYDMNTADLDKISEAKDAVIKIKPYIKAFIDSGAPEQIIDGSAALAVAYDYDYAAAASESDKVGWVAPEEGMPAYLDGWVPLAGSQNLEAVYAFMNFHLETANYADFINTTWASWVMPSVESELDPAVGECDALKPEQSAEVIYAVITPEVSQANATAWQEIQNA